MASSPPKDPAESFRKAVTDLERRIDAMSREFFGTDQFAKTANTANDISSRMRKGFSDVMSQQLATYNMPSRDDVTALGERIMEIEDRLVRIENMLIEALPSPQSKGGGRSGPPRTKKPPARTKAKTKPKKSS